MANIAPPDVLPAEDHSRVLPRYLASQHLALSGSRSGLMPQAVNPVMEGALGLAMTFGVDPSRRVEFLKGSNEVSITMLDAVLLLTNPFKVVDAHRAWPKSLDGFGPELLGGLPREEAVETEWCAAALLAAGCSPWDANAKDLPPAVRTCALSGMSGLFERFMEHPDAWPAQKVAQSIHRFESKNTLLHDLAVDLCPGASRCLEILYRQGARAPDGKALGLMLEAASPGAVEVIARFEDLGALPDKQRRKIMDGWKIRTSNQTLSPESAEKMAAAAWPDAGDAKMRAHAIRIANLLATRWFEEPNGSSSQAYDFQVNLGAELLVAQAKSASGTMSGKWSVLAAAAASRIRSARGNGAHTWSVDYMLYNQFDDKARSYQIADCSQPPFAGCLAPALGFDWRPGIAIDGIVALSLFGQSTERIRADVVQKSITSFQHATGIQDLDQWAARHLSSAVAFTKRVASKPGQRPASLLSVWSAFATRKLGLIQSMDLESRLDLVWTLMNQSPAPMPDANKKFNELAKAVFPGLDENSLSSGVVEPQQRKAALAITLSGLREKTIVPQDLEKVFAPGVEYSPDELDAMEKWVIVYVPAKLQPLWQARIEDGRLQEATAPAPAASRPSRRI